jgi:hypothetical protein
MFAPEAVVELSVTASFYSGVARLDVVAIEHRLHSEAIGRSVGEEAEGRESITRRTGHLSRNAAGGCQRCRPRRLRRTTPVRSTIDGEGSRVLGCAPTFWGIPPAPPVWGSPYNRVALGPAGKRQKRGESIAVRRLWVAAAAAAALPVSTTGRALAGTRSRLTPRSR